YSVMWSGLVSGSDTLDQNGTYAITNLVEGSYLGVVTDANGCTAECTVNIEISDCLLTIDQIDVLPVSCPGNADGAIQIFVSGGIPPYLYSLDGIQYQPENVFTDLAAGTYTVFVEDAAGCDAVGQIDIPVNPGPSLELTGIAPASCGEDNGSIEVKPVGGTMPYSFSIGGPYQPVGIFNGLASGSYFVYLLDANGCTDTLEVEIEDIGAPSIDDIIVTDPTCGQANGAILVLASGGTPPLQYSIGGALQFSN